MNGNGGYMTTRLDEENQLKHSKCELKFRSRRRVGGCLQFGEQRIIIALVFGPSLLTFGSQTAICLRITQQHLLVMLCSLSSGMIIQRVILDNWDAIAQDLARLCRSGDSGDDDACHHDRQYVDHHNKHKRLPDL
jgi:hypothetical protein